MSDTAFAENYLSKLTELLPKLDREKLGQTIAKMREVRDNDKTIYICGNGGSASIASQMVVDIVKGASYQKKKRFKMIGLTDSMSTLSAYANDVGYDIVFLEPLKNFAVKGDMLITISGSGNSANVLRATEYANEIGVTTVGLTTGDGGKLKDLVDIPLTLPSNHMGHLEDSFFIMSHVLCYAFMEAD
ncbi:Phosphoheptose isomerase 1 [Polystyrenella longa]|uniref:Phosphoheptose isomerase 1 n=1 Tax=Polystyrenella longa TaxID=2528007 RepID=A0A518CN76_9PLAN|nr:SIS domain-containing protein [Polystyrenella longa]QDU80668.1 Phosphoheptose isomerase 1 [Polystyrenella longa]